MRNMFAPHTIKTDMKIKRKYALYRSYCIHCNWRSVWYKKQNLALDAAERMRDNRKEER